MLEVLEAGGLATVQDGGRTGWRRFGVPSSGPMDLFAFQAANTERGVLRWRRSFGIGFDVQHK